MAINFGCYFQFTKNLDAGQYAKKKRAKAFIELANFRALLIDKASWGDYYSEPTIRCIKTGCEVP